MEHEAIIYWMATETEPYIGHCHMTRSNRKWGAGFLIQVERTHQALWFSLDWYGVKEQCRHRNNLLLRHPTHTCPTTVAVSLIASKYDCSLWGKDLPRVLDTWHSWMTNSGRRISWRLCSFEKASCLEGHLFQSLSGADAGTSFDIQSNADVSPTDVTTPCSWSWSWPSFNLPAHWLIGQTCLDLPSGYPMADLFCRAMVLTRSMRYCLRQDGRKVAMPGH